MHLRLLYMMSLLLLWFPPRGYSQTEAWAISGSFDKIATDDAGCLYTVSKNVLTKYDTLGNALWSKTYAAPIECLTSGRDSAMYIAGIFTNAIQMGNQIVSPYGFRNIYLARLSSVGDVQWVRQISGSQAIGEMQLASDSKGNIYFSGVTQSTSIFVDSVYVGQVAGYAIFFQKFSRDGTFRFQKGGFSLGTNPYRISLNTISVDRQDNVHVLYGSNNSNTFPPKPFDGQSRAWFDSTGLLIGYESDITRGIRETFRGYKARNNPADYLFTKISNKNFNVESTILPNCSAGSDCYNSPPINPDYDDFDNTYYAGQYPMINGYFYCSRPLPPLLFSCAKPALTPSGPYRNIYVIINDTLVSTQKDSLIDEYPVWLAADPNGKSLYLLATWYSYFPNPPFRFGNSVLSEPGSMVLRYRIDKTYPLVVNAGEDKTICVGGRTAIGAMKLAKGGKAPYSYQWWPETGLDNANSSHPTANPSSTTEYIVAVADAAGTVVTDTVKVVVDSTLYRPTIEVLSGG
ncbi:MAG TPA: hypothetical protein VFT06_01845, partial [Flavisolibacter sp.]|nr:hypothetical protein [Flavisolibacter sp.]